jgi:hypothetical protein
VAACSGASTVFALSNTWVLRSNPTGSKDISVSSLLMLSLCGHGVVTGNLPNVYKTKKLEKRPRPNTGPHRNNASHVTWQRTWPCHTPDKIRAVCNIVPISLSYILILLSFFCSRLPNDVILNRLPYNMVHARIVSCLLYALYTSRFDFVNIKYPNGIIVYIRWHNWYKVMRRLQWEACHVNWKAPDTWQAPDIKVCM